MEPVAVAATETKDKPRYQDQFQQNIGSKVEEVGKKIVGQGRNILYGLGVIAVLAIIVWIFYAWSGRSNAAAQTALGKAIEISQRRVTDTPPLAGSPEKTFKTERERAEASIAEFQSVANLFGGDVGEKAKYFIAVNRLNIDRPAGISELETISKGSGDSAKLAKFALAQTQTDDGKYDEAAKLYSELAALPDPIVAKDSINFELAKIYEKEGKKQEAVDLLFTIVKTATDAKDLDGKAAPLGRTAEAAKEKLKELDPEKAKEIPEQAPDPSVSGNPFG